MLTDETHAVMERHELDSLLEYSYSVPTGTTIGKRWRRMIAFTWYLGEYTADPSGHPDRVVIKWREILLV
jgi:hypothetical protein